MNELANLQHAVADAIASMQAAIDKLSQPHINPADVQAAADALSTKVVELNAAVAA